jgi:outer membrane receptor protein involved in Fe transport
VTNETRFSWDPVSNLSGTVGVFYSKTHTKFWIPDTTATGLQAATVNNQVVGPWPNDLIWTQYNPGIQRDISLFGEVYYKFLDRFTLTLGAREYWLKQRSDYIADGFMNFGLTPSYPIDHSEVGFNPKLALSYQATDSTMLYSSASKGFRAGGAQAFTTFCSYPGLNPNDIAHLRSDTLWTYEGGAKIQLSNPAMLISAAGFHIDWNNIQQQVSLPCGYYFDVNGKEATINGGEVEVSGRPFSRLSIHGGVGYEDTSINQVGALGIPGIGVQDGSRIFGVPAWTATLGAVYSVPLSDTLIGLVSADYSYTGNSVSLLAGGTSYTGGAGLQATRPAYSLVNARAALQWDVHEVSLNLRNLTNAKPNLGDIGYVGYAQFNSAGTVIPQVAVLQPFTVTLQYKYNF